ncbi:hypothetical protein R3P38DRAFT_2811842 [Favolaschia claudopus]|uniref:Uncharacterized protein n=1 Tax=Favolaschia claudopus TaxID=2862362 RepID=A0AAV9Z8L4_9AGAR
MAGPGTRKKRAKQRNITPPPQPVPETFDGGVVDYSDTEYAQQSPPTAEMLSEDPPSPVFPDNSNDSDVDDLGENFSRLASSDVEHSSHEPEELEEEEDNSSEDIELVSPRDSSAFKIKIPARPATPGTSSKPIEIEFSPAKKATKRVKGATSRTTVKKQRVDKPLEVLSSDSDSDLPPSVPLPSVNKKVRTGSKPAASTVSESPSPVEPVVKRKPGRPRREQAPVPVELSAHVYCAYTWAVLRRKGRGTTARQETEQKMSPLQGPFSLTTFRPADHRALVASIAETMHIRPTEVNIESLRWAVVKGSKAGPGYPLYDENGFKVMRESLPMVSQGGATMHFQITLARPVNVSAVEALGEAEAINEEPITKLDTLLGGKVIYCSCLRRTY